MSKRRLWILVVGCVLLVGGVFVAFVAVSVLAATRLPGDMILSVHLAGPVVEVRADDPFAELMGDTTVSVRELRTALLRAADDDRVRGLRLRVDAFGGGLAHAHEIRSLIAGVSAAGKWTAAYIDTAGEFAPGNGTYLVASACEELSLNPMGDVNLIGLSARVPFIRGTLDKLGVRPEFPGRGDYKTARFMYTETDFTPAHREMTEWLLDSVMEIFVEGIASSRGLLADNVRNLIDRGPFLGAEAVEAGLVDRLEDWTELNERLDEREDGHAKVIGLRTYLKRGRESTTGPKIAVVTAVGTILRGKSQQSVNPLVGEVMGSETIAKAWRDVRKASGIKAAVFRIDSPGGSAIASEVIRQEMARTAEQIPVVVSLTNVGASGGYWITCGAQRVVAYPSTITGSIGVFGGHLNMDGFWSDKLGVTFGRVDRGANANLYGDLEDWNDSQRVIIDRLLDRIYSSFLERVSASRGMTTDEVDAIGRGRVFTGVQAAGNGLVDALGGFDDAVAEARQLAGIDPARPVRLVDFPKALPWWQQLMQQGRHEQVALRQELEQWWRTGSAAAPGVAWMPPLIIE